MKKNPVKRGDILEVYVDGASRGNPGPAAWAFIFVKNEEIIHQKSAYIGHTTNNLAEYKTIVNALKEAKQFSRWHLKIFSDSELVVRQIIRSIELQNLIFQSYVKKFIHFVNFLRKLNFLMWDGVMRI